MNSSTQGFESLGKIRDFYKFPEISEKISQDGKKSEPQTTYHRLSGLDEQSEETHKVPV